MNHILSLTGFGINAYEINRTLAIFLNKHDYAVWNQKLEIPTLLAIQSFQIVR